MADLERNKAVTRAMFEDLWRDHRLERGEALVAPDFVLHIWGEEKRGRDGMAHALENVWLAAFPDLSCAVLLQIAEGDLVADHVTFSGTHTGAPFHGIEPSGAAFTFTQTTISRIEDGRVAEVWEDFDWRGLVQQLRG
ncbi:MAG TPA: ester cyclase [Gaiellaceae bacterium]|nr:ester cyclase [Gaiellaceae bacterium]